MNFCKIVNVQEEILVQSVRKDRISAEMEKVHKYIKDQARLRTFAQHSLVQGSEINPDLIFTTALAMLAQPDPAL